MTAQDDVMRTYINPDQSSNTYIREVMESRLFERIRTTIEGTMHSKMVAYTTKRTRELHRVLSEGEYCDSMQEFWEALPAASDSNYTASTGEPDETLRGCQTSCDSTRSPS